MTQVSQSRAKLSELLFWAAFGFGAVHFAGISLEIAGQLSGAVLAKFPMKSSMLMGNFYLAVLSAYVGQKEFSRWQSDPGNTVLGPQIMKKISRGEVIIGLWTLLLGVTVFLSATGRIISVPEPLLCSVGEIVMLYFGTGASKYLKKKKQSKVKEIKAPVNEKAT